MKKYLVLMIGSFLLIDVAVAKETTIEPRRRGLWCTSAAQPEFLYTGQALAPTTDCLLYGPGVPSGDYRKLADERWQRFTTDKIPAEPQVFLAAGTLETLSANLLAATPSATVAKTRVIIQSPALDGLMRKGQIEWQPASWQGVSLKDKRVAVVLSSQTIDELNRFKRERQALINATAGMQDQRVREARAKFIAASNPDRLLTIVAKVFRKYVKEVQPVDDLAGLKKGDFDYALVVHWKSFTRFDLLGKYADFQTGSYEDWLRGTTPARMGSWLSGILINADLKAVQIYSPDRPYINTKDKTEGGETLDYISSLGYCFELDWGASVDDLGVTGGSLDFQMKGFR